MESDVTVSMREFAKVVGKSHTWIRTLVKNGKLPTDESGAIWLNQGLKAMNTRQSNSDSMKSMDEIKLEFQKAKLAELQYRVELLKIDLEECRLKYVKRADVVKDATLIRDLLTRELYAMIPSMADRCVGKSHREIEAILENEIHVFLNRTAELLSEIS